MMNKVTAEVYHLDPQRYDLVSGHQDGAPTCVYGNLQEWVGYDKKDKKFIRFTKSVFKRLIQQKRDQI